MKTFVYFIHTHIDNTTEFNVNIESYIPFGFESRNSEREREMREKTAIEREKEIQTGFGCLMNEQRQRRRIDSNN